MNKNKSSILFLGKKGDEYGARALKFCEDNFEQVTSCMSNWGDNMPPHVAWWDGDYIISYLSRWILPKGLLAHAKKAAINFHPASPEYPGIGCNNFALYENAKEYGATCHHMTAQVDTGEIIAVRRFPVFASDTVASILSRTYDNQLVLFYDIMGLILTDTQLPVSNECWTRKPVSRKEFNELSKITSEMDKEEVARRIRATSFENWQPFIELHGFKFEYKDEQTNR